MCSTQDLSGYVLFEPGSDGISDGVNTIQGVRNFDPALATWTSPDAYAGDASDPMSRKSYMWNRNNSFAYSDPTGFDPTETPLKDNKGNVVIGASEKPAVAPKGFDIDAVVEDGKMDAELQKIPVVGWAGNGTEVLNLFRR